ncbi:FliH/SctL family protein [Alkalihalobacillus sp. CinArs1]|uniref:FliH/SctL family protein n=1 Tax=Alkalihalobacillus sp. CinArs1 TaxID=2995314 RepID=UPI0022DE32B5|nr:FliH/SctL family protein [Alkalihalobacillus sp. CinArs1]
MSNIIPKSYKGVDDAPKVIGQRDIVEPKKQRVLQSRKSTVEEKKSQLLQQMIRLEDQYHTIRTRLQNEEDHVLSSLEQKQLQKEQEWEKLAEQKYREAEDKGFEAGYQAGLQQVQFELQEKRKEMESVLTEAYKKKDELIQSAEPFLLSLSTEIAKKVMMNELKQHPESIAEMVRKTLQTVQDRGEVVLQVSVEDYAHITPMVEELEKQLDGHASLKLVPMSDLPPGSGMIHTPSGSYDISIHSQLKEIKKELFALFEENDTDEH